MHEHRTLGQGQGACEGSKAAFDDAEQDYRLHVHGWKHNAARRPAIPLQQREGETTLLKQQQASAVKHNGPDQRPC